MANRNGFRWDHKSVSTAAQSLRAFFRHAEFRAWCQPGIAKLIEKPRAYQKDGLPNGPTWPDVHRLVKDTEGRKPTDYRARAMVLLLAVYGLRSSEVAGLVLSDFDWRAERLAISRQKGGGSRQYPLVHEVGEAVLDYLRHGRPRCECRNFFRQPIPSPPCNQSICGLGYRQPEIPQARYPVPQARTPPARLISCAPESTSIPSAPGSAMCL
jgi:integrase/recombinase XerD